MGQRRTALRVRTCRFEPLERRQLLSASEPMSPNIVISPHGIKPNAVGSAAPVGLTPAQVRAAYGFDAIVNGTQRSITFGGVKADGAGTTIAIVDAFDNPTILASLKAFDKQFNIPDPGNNAFKVVNQTGGTGTALPPPDPGWAAEIALDVEWAHAIAPAANILLVEAMTDSLSDLLAAVDYARSQPGVVVVSCSWGGPEFAGENGVDPLTGLVADSYFTSPGNRGITFTVSAGDDGAPAGYPSASPNVLSVGGTSLTVGGASGYGSESVWSLGGGGASLYERAPTFQKSIGLKMRGTPDVSYNADPLVGFAVYDSFNNTQTGGWYTVGTGGTSAGAPQWAALIAIADQGRARLGKGSLANAQAALYSFPRADFHDILAGTNGNLATVGYDLASGLGSPRANLVIPALVAWNGSTTLPTATTPGTITTPTGTNWWWSKYFTARADGGASATTAGNPIGGAARSENDLAAVSASSETDASVVIVQSAVPNISPILPSPIDVDSFVSERRNESSLPARSFALHLSGDEISAIDAVISGLDSADALIVQAS